MESEFVLISFSLSVCALRSSCHVYTYFLLFCWLRENTFSPLHSACCFTSFVRCHRFFFLIEFLIYINFHNRKLYVSWLHCNSTSILPQAKLLRSKRKLWNELEWCQSKPVCECMRQCSSSSGWTRIDSIKENAQRVWLLRCKHSHHIAANGSRIIYI